MYVWSVVDVECQCAPRAPRARRVRRAAHADCAQVESRERTSVERIGDPSRRGRPGFRRATVGLVRYPDADPCYLTPLTVPFATKPLEANSFCSFSLYSS